MINLTEREIIIQLQKGNLENFSTIYNKYYKKTFYIILKMLKDEKLAEDITQEVFLDMLTGIKNLRNIDIFNSWLIKIAINKVNLNIKNKIKTNNLTNTINIDSINPVEDMSANLEELILKSEFSRELLSVINKLPENKARVIKLYYYNNLSIREIALIENVPLGTVKSRLHSAKKMLKASIKIPSASA